MSVSFVSDIMNLFRDIEFKAGTSSPDGKFKMLDEQLKEEGATTAFIETAITIYKNVLESELGMLLFGRSGIREDRELIANFGLLSKDNLVQVSNSKTTLQKGAILCEKKWNIFVNDLVMHGVIMRNASCHFPSRELKVSHVWDEHEQRPTVFGRELLMIASNGYIKIEIEGDEGVLENEDVEIAFAVPKEKRKDPSTMEAKTYFVMRRELFAYKGDKERVISDIEKMGVKISRDDIDNDGSDDNLSDTQTD